MTRTLRRAILFVIPVVIVAAGFVVTFGAGERSADSRGRSRSSRAPLSSPTKPCALIVTGRTPLYWCSDRHAWTRAANRWKDVGPLTPLPVVPAS